MTQIRSVAVVALIALVIPSSLGQVPSGGSCPKNVETVQDFDVGRYVGRWYEYSKYPFVFEFNGKCIYAEYGELPDGKVSVYNFNINRLTGNPSDIKGSASIVGPGKLNVKFDSMPSFLNGSNYWVLGTDYTNYSVVYSCTDFFGVLNTKVVWILTRQRQPSPDVVATAKEIITRNGLSLRSLQKTDQSNCDSGSDAGQATASNL